MTQSKLFGSYQSNLVSTNTTSAGLNWGVNFYSEVEGYISALKWYYHGGTSDNRRPDAITLYDAGTGLALAQFIPAAADGAAQTWSVSNINSPVHVSANQHLSLVAHYPGTSGAVWRYWYIPNANPPVPEWPLHWETNAVRQTGGGIAWPTVAGQGSYPMLDITFDTEYNPNPTSPSTVGSVENALADWLSAADGIYPNDSLPDLTHQIVTQLATDEASRYTILEARFGFGGFAAAGTSLWAWLQANVPTIASIASLAADTLAIKNQINPPATTDDLGTVAANTYGAILRAQGRDSIAVGGSGWTLQDDYDGSASHFYEQFADAYVLTWTDVSAPTTKQIVDGVDMVWARDHWACECRDGAVGKHFPLNGRVNDIRIPGTRMPGLLVHNPGGYPFNVQAWVYTG